MITIKTIAVPKEGSKYYGNSNSSSSNGNISVDDISGLDLLWKKGTGQNSLLPTYSQNITTNESEVAVGHFNVSGEGALFEVGNGTDDENRSNVFTAFSDGRSVSPIFNATTNIDTPLALVTKLQSNTIVNDGDVKSNTFTGNSAKITTVNATTANISTINSNNIINKDTIKTKNLTVTGTAHFFELIIDKIKAAGGAALFTPADGFDVDVVESVSGGYKLYWKCEADGKVRQNMWKVNDQAICMSFNQGKLGTSYNTSNKYYWSLVTAVSEYSKPVTLGDGHKYNWITISTSTCDGTVNPEVGDSIAMLGYRGTDDEKRQSAIYITAYASFDKGIDAPFIAQYKGIRDFDIENYRTSWWSLNTNKFVGDFVIESTGENLIDYINSKSSSLSVDLEGIKTKVQQNTTNITTVNDNLDGLKKTVKDNYSTLDQKADSISSTVSSHTQIIEGLDGRVTTNTENISKIKQTADSITSTVTALDQTVDANTGEITTLKKSMSEIGQSADNIYMKIVNDLQETGIDITSGRINLQATNTNIIGNLNVYKSDIGVVIYDDETQERVSIANKKIGQFNDVNSGADMLRTATGKQAFDNTTVCNNQFTDNWYCAKKSVQSPIIDLGHFSVGDYISSYQNPENSPKIYCTTSFLGSKDDIDDANKNMPKCIAIDNARISVMKDGVEIKTYNIGNVSGEQNYFVDKYIVGYTLTNGILSQQKDHTLTWSLSKVDGNGNNIVEQNLYLITLTWKFIYYTDINHTNVEWYHTVTEAGNYSLCIKGDLVFGPVEYLRDDATHGWGKKGNYSIGNNWYFSNEQTYLLNKSNQQRTVIGIDGIASIIGTNKLMYIGQDGIIAKWNNSVLKLDDDGISEVKYYTNVDGSQLEMAKRLGGAYCVEVNGNSSTTASNPYVFGVLDGIDVVVTTGYNVLVGLPMDPQDGRIITVIPKAEGTWVNFNRVNYMRHNSATREVNNSIYLNRYETRKYVYEKMSNIWFEI